MSMHLRYTAGVKPCIAVVVLIVISWNYTDSVTNARLQDHQRSFTRSMDAYMQQPYYSASD
jgi:hypothetical protein